MATVQELVKAGVRAIRLPDMPIGHRVVVAVRPDIFVLYDGNVRLHPVWMGVDQWNDARCEQAEAR